MSFSIQPCPPPDNALLNKYRRDGGYTDCYVTEIPIPVSHAHYVNAFYTTALFKLERFILTWTVSKPSTDMQAKQLADGTRDAFAAWTVEARTEKQLLMCDFVSRTRSWLMILPLESGTRLYFGSAVVPVVNSRTGKSTLGLGVRLLLGFHKVYSVALLYAARSRLEKTKGDKK
jgi:hypothetical protein